MISKYFLPVLIFFAGCASPQPPAEKVITKPPEKRREVKPVPPPNPWLVKNYVDSDGEPKDKKYGRFDADGTYSDPSVQNGYLHAVILLNKENAGILLHRDNRSNPARKFENSVTIRMKNSEGTELELISSRGWNRSGGILIEQNNNDYSRFRIFMLQSKGLINVEILGDSSDKYLFDIDATGFGDSLSQI